MPSSLPFSKYQQNLDSFPTVKYGVDGADPDVYFLDGDLYYFERALPGVISPSSVREGGDRAVLLFREEARARGHLAGLPAGFVLRELCGDDFRAKEEFLRAALAGGAAVIFLDADARTLTPAERHAVREALDYVLSFKNQAACL